MISTGVTRWAIDHLLASSFEYQASKRVLDRGFVPEFIATVADGHRAGTGGKEPELRNKSVEQVVEMLKES